MNFLQDIQNALASVESFSQHLPPEVQPDFAAAVSGVKTVANAAADAGVAVATTEAATVPVFGPILATAIGAWLDSLIAEAQAAKATVTPKAA